MATQLLPGYSQAHALTRTRSLALSATPLLLILTLQLIASLSLRNTAFQDEALYVYAGRQIVTAWFGGPPVAEPWSQYFSGLPYLQPVIAGTLDSIGGLELARAFSLFCMLGATVAVAAITRQLFDNDSAIFAAALFSVQASVLFLGRLATYDAMSLGLLALAAVLAVRFGSRANPLPVPLVGVVLAVAVLTKYAGFLFVPTVLALLGWCTLQTRGWRAALARMFVAGAALGGCLAAMLLLPETQQMLQGLTASTTDRTVDNPASRLLLLLRVLTLSGALIAVAFGGLLVVRRRERLLGLILWGSMLLAPAYHIYKGELISLHKHVAFGVLFGAPLAGVAVARLSGYGRRAFVGYRWVAGLAICLLLFAGGLQNSRLLFAEWSTSDALIRTLRTVVRPGGGRYLSEESEVTRYYLQGTVAWWQWSHLYWFEYTDTNGQRIQGQQAYRAAINDEYFDLVILRYGPNVVMDQAIDAGLNDGKHYELIAKLPFTNTFGSGYYWVWRKLGNTGVASAP